MNSACEGKRLTGKPPDLLNRLMAVAQYVRKGSIAADIGTDHALLPIWLTMNFVCPKVYACDVKKGPLERAGRNIGLYGEKERVPVRQAFGLDGLEGTGVSDIVIAGMGGELIGEIILKAPWVKNPQIRLILQPMSSVEDLRKWLWGNGFAIEAERVAQDADKLFVVLCVSFNGEPVKYSRLCELVGNPLLKREDPLFGALLKGEIVRQKKILKGLLLSKNPGENLLAREIEPLIGQLEEELKEWKKWQR